jgi:hypothetical protein
MDALAPQRRRAGPVTTVFTVREAGPADYLAMAELLDAEDFGEHGRQCRRALDAGRRMDGHWQVAVAGSTSNSANMVVGVVHADLAIDYGRPGHEPWPPAAARVHLRHRD